MLKYAAIAIAFLCCATFYCSAQIEGSNMLLEGNHALIFDCKGASFIKQNRSQTLFTTSISDTLGNLLFYVGDSNVYDNNFNKTAVLDSVSVAYDVNFILIVPNPISDDLYYIFYGGYNGSTRVIRYSSYSVSAHKLSTSAVLCRYQDYVGYTKVPGVQVYWIISQGPGYLSAYKIDNGGVHIPGIETLNMPVIGSPVKMNNDGNQLCGIGLGGYADSLLYVHLDFNNSSGYFTTYTKLYLHNSLYQPNCYRYQSAISPDDTKYYLPLGCGCGACNNFSLIQYDISTINKSAIMSSASAISATDHNRHDWTTFIDGADCKIYNYNYGYSFSVINAPDSSGAKADYGPMQMSGGGGYNYSCGNFLTRQDYWPSFSIDTAKSNLARLIFTYNAPKKGETCLWDFGDTGSGALNTDTGFTANHVFAPHHVYYVRLLVFRNGYHTTFTRMVCVNAPIMGTVLDTALCVLHHFILDAGDTGAKYSWPTGDTTQKITISQFGKYWVKITKNASTVTDSFLVTQKTIHLKSNTAVSVCHGDSARLTAGMAGARYLWSTGDTTTGIFVKKQGVYRLLVDSDGCMASDSFIVSVISPPVADIGNDTGICAGMAIRLTTASATAHDLWSTGDTTPSISASVQGIYWLRLDSAGCYSYDTMLLTVNPLPAVSPHPVSYFCIYDSTGIWLTEPTTARYRWQNGGITPSIRVSDEGTYRLVLTSAEGCQAADSFVVKSNCPGQIFFPDAFSPNQDGHNDTYKAIAFNIIQFNMSIYNRWGACLYTTHDINQGWDGTFKGRGAPGDVYLYVATYQLLGQSPKAAQGTVTLLR